MACDISSLGFPAGTSIQTPDGPLPIEQIRVGMQVLAQPEAGGERAYRPVLNTVTHLDQEVYAVQVKVAGADSLTTLFATGGHPFWVAAPLVDSEHWMATECLAPGFVLQLADGSKATVHAVGLIRQTQFPEIGFAADERAGLGIVLDLSTRHAKLASDAVALKLGRLEVGEPWLTPVYNFEVEEFHTYYVGEVGVWVHNNGCTPEEAIGTAREIQEIKDSCFSGDTRVLMEGGKLKPIERVLIGDKVLSRCEFTGELAYKEVLDTFEHSTVEGPEDEIPAYIVYYSTTSPRRKKDGEGVIHATPEQTIELFGFREIAAREVQRGDVFFTNGRTQVLVVRVETDQGGVHIHWTSGWGALHVTPEHMIWVQGKGWTAVADLQQGDQFETCDGAEAIIQRIDKTDCELNFVYNLHVEDFHTYFVDSGIWVHNTKVTEHKSVDKLPVKDAAATHKRGQARINSHPHPPPRRRPAR